MEFDFDHCPNVKRGLIERPREPQVVQSSDTHTKHKAMEDMCPELKDELIPSEALYSLIKEPVEELSANHAHVTRSRLNDLHQWPDGAAFKDRASHFVVAVHDEDEDYSSEYSYYIVRCIKAAHTLEDGVQDSFSGCKFNKGRRVIEGRYYQLVKGKTQSDRLYTYLYDKPCYIEPLAVRYIHFPMRAVAAMNIGMPKEKWVYQMDTQDHEAAMAAITRLF